MAQPEEDVRFDFLTLFQFENRGIDRSIVELVDDAEARFIELISRDNRAEGRGWKSNGQSFWQQPVLETYIHTLVCTRFLAVVGAYSNTSMNYLALNFASMRLLVFPRRCYLFKGNSLHESVEIHPPSVLTYPVIKAVLVLIASCNNVSSVNNVSTLHDKQNVCRGTRKTRG